ncbi:hypothetical protein [Pseudobacteriovorax antillogorgiicola]|uniref:Lipoprotein n=1 Tax=Pseudobacteriovorax antillogorgiicola TaxID=1513793 RepID=A0A1Y6C6U4_9BACT|nr:hypothetical protein [Pseudobacteriovorax antillogorgiicola]TCS50655.1 hypothetical protein EDD56_11237 [Pseudobacteriovorax antillogorgiicola]SMF39791.1 hypothetical protein SAMN06296036_11236 [Pseudobacteriovorax antillogorgiicola]
MKSIKLFTYFLASSVLFGCGSTAFQNAPQIKRRSVTAGAEGAQVSFDGVVAKADAFSGPDAGDKFAALLVETQFRLMTINNTGASIAGSEETGHCMALSAETAFDEESLSSSLVLSKKGKVVYSKSDTMKASECQAFFQEEIAGKIRKEFFDIHISFFSLTF